MQLVAYPAASLRSSAFSNVEQNLVGVLFLVVIDMLILPRGARRLALEKLIGSMKRASISSQQIWQSTLNDDCGSCRARTTLEVGAVRKEAQQLLLDHQALSAEAARELSFLSVPFASRTHEDANHFLSRLLGHVALLEVALDASTASAALQSRTLAHPLKDALLQLHDALQQAMDAALAMLSASDATTAPTASELTGTYVLPVLSAALEALRHDFMRTVSDRQRERRLHADTLGDNSALWIDGYSILTFNALMFSTDELIREFHHLRDAIAHLLLITRPVALGSFQNMHDEAAAVASIFEESLCCLPTDDAELQKKSASYGDSEKVLQEVVAVRSADLPDAERMELSHRAVSSGDAGIQDTQIAFV
jgi:hypothetical protein